MCGMGTQHSDQYIKNDYEKPLYRYNQKRSELNFDKAYTIPKIKNIFQTDIDNNNTVHLTSINQGVNYLSNRYPRLYPKPMTVRKIDKLTQNILIEELNELDKKITKRYNKVSELLEKQKPGHFLSMSVVILQKNSWCQRSSGHVASHGTARHPTSPQGPLGADGRPPALLDPISEELPGCPQASQQNMPN